jgi:hypothetical protein
MNSIDRKYKEHLENLSGTVGVFLRVMDVLMQRPSDDKRGRDIALLLNKLEMQNDQARYFALGVDYQKDKKESLTDAQVDVFLHGLKSQR